jgi:hypothetical protein
MEISFSTPFRSNYTALLSLERFSNSRALNDSKESGFFLRKKPLSSRAFGVQQLENRYSWRCQLFVSVGAIWQEEGRQSGGGRRRDSQNQIR